METEKRLIDANELTNFFGFMRKMWSGSEIMNVIDEAEAVDAVEVVRCKDCYHNEQCICVCCEDGEMIKCGLHHKHMDATGYCHKGRRC